MRIAIMGTGGLGGYFGARLAQVGCEVTFIARGAHLEAIRHKGLRVYSGLGDMNIYPAQAAGDPAHVGRVDTVIFAVKLWDTERAAAQLSPLLGAQTMVVSFQNGVEKDEVLAGIIGREHVVGGVGYIAAAIESPGVIRHTGTMQRLLFGELDGARTPRVEAFAAACSDAGILNEISPDIHRTTWEKFVFLVGLSAATSLMRQPIGVIRANERSRSLFLQIMREVVNVGRASGVALDPAFAEGRLTFGDTLPAEMVASMSVDLQRGNRLELPWLSGAVERLGRQVGVATPANAFVTDALALYVEGSPRDLGP
ncbi:2-dehydropantoate 2-reductase [bacterium]|nr:MAG: 2-dehydropantoate 2-reductase [bacterium]